MAYIKKLYPYTNIGKIVLDNEILIGDISVDSIEEPGMIKWDGTNFKGYTGTSGWVELDGVSSGITWSTPVDSDIMPDELTYDINIGSPSSKFGNLYIDTVYGSLIGNASTATLASTLTITEAGTVPATSFPLTWATGDFLYKTTNTTNVLSIIPSTGALTSASTMTATNFILSSDSRLKENIKPIESNSIDDVELKEFNLISDPDKKRYGVIAQDLEQKHPEMIYESAEGFKQVAYIDFLIAKIDSLEKRIQKIEAK